MGIPEKLIRITILTMKNYFVMVKIKHISYKQFAIKEGLRQGDPLVRLLFNLSLEKALRHERLKTKGAICNKWINQILACANDYVVIGSERSLFELRINSEENGFKSEQEEN